MPATLPHRCSMTVARAAPHQTQAARLL